MKPLSSIEIKLCQKQAEIFEESVNKTPYSSPIFIRRFMYSSISKSFDEKLFLFRSESVEEVFALLDQEFGPSEYGKVKYSPDQMFWIGYIYRCLSIKYNLSSMTVYKLFKANEIVKYYNICHTFDIVEAAERMMDSINYDDTPIEKKAYECMKKLIYQERLMNYLGKSVTVSMDNNQNYGYVNDIKNLSNKKIRAYVIGKNEISDSYNGKIIAIIDKIMDNDYSLVVCGKEQNFTKEEILEKLSFPQKNIKRKIIMHN